MEPSVKRRIDRLNRLINLKSQNLVGYDRSIKDGKVEPSVKPSNLRSKYLVTVNIKSIFFTETTGIGRYKLVMTGVFGKTDWLTDTLVIGKLFVI